MNADNHNLHMSSKQLATAERSWAIELCRCFSLHFTSQPLRSLP